MAIQSTRKVILGFTGDQELTEVFNAAANPASPQQSQIVNLASGANTITVPTGGTTAVAVVIQPPAANTVLMTLKGVTGDTGVPLHKTDSTSVAIDSTCTTFCLTAAAAITGVRLYWS